ncbi:MULTISPECIES: hypothetical protein [Mesorhizobium]|uniref:hypothetical protein n=1 Tax=Mesorhizobium TaxID=68287 RepID=UPI0007ED6F70|nr:MULTISPECIES: hypothetical protein [unclassified Mesorhizobium]ARP67233.1 hypothetical protein A9K65_030775 [Mesorhizobium sp. WSM1497]PBC13771.1 hypothetical protein CK225_24455 [Mesorhizobium loti]TPJ40390.1 hypothetical protein FJ437_26080 [Mesorhizobium sp. B2-6-6]TPJ92985.1 hypothetical protein FJ489_22400 [Mesorhizobium sp. B2-5-12]MCA0002817.1 hypothetical protein [Mesorhizobium sp. B264B2A]
MIGFHNNNIGPSGVEIACLAPRNRRIDVGGEIALLAKEIEEDLAGIDRKQRELRWHQLSRAAMPPFGPRRGA